MNTGDMTENHARFRFWPLTNAQDEIEAVEVNILGLGFVLLLETPDLSKHAFLRGARYRPSRIVISSPRSTGRVTMSWDDGNAHEPLMMRFVRRVQQRTA